MAARKHLNGASVPNEHANGAHIDPTKFGLNPDGSATVGNATPGNTQDGAAPGNAFRSYTEQELADAIQQGFRAGAVWGARQQAMQYHGLVQRLEKRLRRVKHALHAVTTEALQS